MTEKQRIDLFHGSGGHYVAWQNPRNPHMRIGWLVNENHFERAMHIYLPTSSVGLRRGSLVEQSKTRNGHGSGTQIEGDVVTKWLFLDFATQRNGRSGREKDLLNDWSKTFAAQVHVVATVLQLNLSVHL
jgi:hypothetical protein